MKKFLAIALIAASFVACNEGKKEETTTPAVDTTVAAPVVDTTVKVADSATAPVVADSTKK
ncbi:MAG: hypothetical protein ACOYLO_04045 [Ferruginibacter sp.]|jgi:hypothetical protein